MIQLLSESDTLNIIFLLIVVVTLTLQNVFKKSYSQRRKDIFVFNTVYGIAAALLFLVFSKGEFNFCAEIIPYVLGFSVCFITCTFTSLMAVKTGSLALSSLIISYSLTIPTLYGILFLNNPTSLLFYTGIILLLVSLFLVNYEKGEKKITKRWLVYVAFSFVSNGLCSTIQNTQQIKFNGAYKSEFMLTVYILVAVVMGIAAMFTEKQEVKTALNKYTVLALACGIANGLTSLFVMMLSTRMPTSVMFPIISAGSILATALISNSVYKERFSKQQLIGILLGTASIVCLSV